MGGHFTKNIALLTNGHCKQILKIGYSSDGGYWIQDLIRLQIPYKKCGVYKSAIDVFNHGVRQTPILYSAFTEGEAKLSHHYDGKAHISGKGVLSGYNPDGSPRGAAIQSFSLSDTNDGGMIFSFLVWGLIHLKRDGQVGDCILEIDKRRIRSYHQGKPLNAFAIEGYYLLKKLLPKNFDYSQKLFYENPIAGQVVLSLVPSPKNTPGIIGLSATLSMHGFNNEIGFTMSGAPGFIYDKKYCDGLSIVYPCPKNNLGALDLNFR